MSFAVLLVGVGVGLCMAEQHIAFLNVEQTYASLELVEYYVVCDRPVRI